MSKCQTRAKVNNMMIKVDKRDTITYTKTCIITKEMRNTGREGS